MRNIMMSCTFCLVFISSPLCSADEFCETYEAVPQTVIEERPVVTKRLTFDTVVEERPVTTRRPVWKTEMRTQRYTVRKPVRETEMRTEEYTVMRPVYETDFREETSESVSYETESRMREERRIVMKPLVEMSEREESVRVMRPLQETRYRDEYETRLRPVTRLETQVEDHGGFVNSWGFQPRGRVRYWPRFMRGQTYVDPITGQSVYQPPGFYSVPSQRGRLVGQSQYVPNLVPRQVERTEYIPETVARKVPVDVTRWEESWESRTVPTTRYRMVPEEQRRFVPETVRKPVVKQTVRRVPVERITWKREVVQRQVPVERLRYEDEIREEQIPVKVQDFVTEERTERITKKVPRWEERVHIERVPRTITTHRLLTPNYFAPVQDSTIVQPFAVSPRTITSRSVLAPIPQKESLGRNVSRPIIQDIPAEAEFDEDFMAPAPPVSAIR